MQRYGIKREITLLRKTLSQQERDASLPLETCTDCGHVGHISHRCTSQMHGEQRRCVTCVSVGKAKQLIRNRRRLRRARV